VPDFPRNPLESRLLDASAGRIEVEEWLQDFLSASVWVPLTATEGTTGTFPVLTIDGGSYVPAFTSVEELDGAFPEGERVCPPVRELVAVLPEPVGLAVNPGGTVGLPVAGAVLRQALGIPTHVTEGTTFRVGDPVEEPVQLLGEVARALRPMGAVRAARRAWAVIGDGSPGLVLGLDIDPDNDEVRQGALDAVRRVVGAEPAGYPVDVVFDNDRGPLVEWMHDHAEPFHPSPGSPLS
jgi:type III secretion system (T3SS) SseB-like protein